MLYDEKWNPDQKQLECDLLAVRQRVEKGWTQYDYRRGPGACLLGAIGDAVDKSVLVWGGNEPRVVRTIFALSEGVDASGGFSERRRALLIWNDTAGRQKSEVLDLIDRAAK